MKKQDKYYNNIHKCIVAVNYETPVLSFPRRRESRASSEKHWIPAFAGMTKKQSRCFIIQSVVVIISVVASFLFATDAHASTIIQRPLYLGLSNGLVGSWSFDGPDMAGNTAYDHSGNANNGILTNGPTRDQIGQTLEFDGIILDI